MLKKIKTLSPLRLLLMKSPNFLSVNRLSLR